MIIISNEELIAAGCFDIPSGIKVTEETLKLYTQGDVLFPDKISQIFNQDEQTRINCLPATIRSQKISGMKWVAVFPPNPERYNLPNLNAVILLSEIESGYPIAFMDGTLCSNLRTASVSAVAAKYLARRDSEIIGFLGVGEQAKMHLLTLNHVLPNLKICKIASRNPQSEKIFIEQMSQLVPKLHFIACDSNYEKAASDSDIIVTAISGQVPLLKAEWIKEGAYYNHVGGWEDDYKVPFIMDKIVCDDWNSVKHRTQTLSRLYKMGKLKDEDIYADLHEIVSSRKKGRENEFERIYFNPVGLSYIDISLAWSFYKRIQNRAIKPSELKISQESFFQNLNKNSITL